MTRGGSAPGQDDVRGFDDYEVSLGDTMRGERATLGKSLLDVQRELKIKATYIAAIENADHSAFETPGFIAGYVRSYARYLGMDPEECFARFCRESGFEGPRSLGGKPARRSGRAAPLAAPVEAPLGTRDIFDQPQPGFLAGDGPLARIEPAAVASVAVLVALIGGIAWGGWTVLQEVQRVQLAPVDAAPVVAVTVDPLAPEETEVAEAELRAPSAPSAEALDRLYRPRALEVPVLVARDGPIAALDPRAAGVVTGAEERQFRRGAPTPAQTEGVARVAEAPGAPGAPGGAARGELPDAIGAAVLAALAEGEAAPEGPVVREDVPQTVALVAARESWVRVRDAEGATLYEGVMQPGDRVDLPATEGAPDLRTGNAGAVYFEIAGQTYGPAGGDGEVANVAALTPDALTAAFTVADLEADADIARVLAEATVD
ncbi:cytoskeletal protein RodZ [Hasllibacter halocynthiae]|uniref:Cytoskeletal protein RodZ n=1 Tax=Hasllibacter halocynthiae TaxID=595589 RepID=A0A2T0X7L5_9RHOB|nr:helix-turn-helix domain-containing protein [Hasllibacter halocynthiae]PRY94941.1 cytoskeletal protein RodZ [Hasllibacter halocynthiae]